VNKKLELNMAKKYFGTDGIRGKVGEYPITADFMLKLGLKHRD
jgi:phosphomannomutase